MTVRSRAAAWLLLVATASEVACDGSPAPEQAGNRDTISLKDSGRADVVANDVDAGADSAPPATGTWTAGVVDFPSGDPAVSTLVSVRTARHGEFDRVVWELDGEIPGVHVEYVDEPVRACGSGEPVPLPGDAWLEVRITPVNAHTEAGRPTIAERRRATDLPTILEIVQTCDFEAMVTWALAVRSPEPFRLARFGEPSRVVVDVRHPR